MNDRSDTRIKVWVSSQIADQSKDATMITKPIESARALEPTANTAVCETLSRQPYLAPSLVKLDFFRTEGGFKSGEENGVSGVNATAS